MKATINIQPSGNMRFIILICFLFFTGLLKIYAQCNLSAYPNILTFSAINETKSISISNASGCPFRVGAPAFLESNISGNNLYVKLSDNYSGMPGTTVTVEILLLHQSSGTILLKIPVEISLAPSVVPLSGGSISCSTTSIVSGNSPGTIGNSSSPSGGTGSYTYQWQQSINNGSTWTNISGATGLTYSCPVLTITTSFRRSVTSGSQTSYSNTVKITVEGPVTLSPSSNRNYILTQTMLDNTGNLSFNKIDYYDGLGRPSEMVMHNASPGQKDIVTLQEYDEVGRLLNSYIPSPVSTANGSYVEKTTFKAKSNSFHGDAYAYEKTVYEASPLDRITDKYGAGAAWHTGEKRVTTNHFVNSSSEELSCALYAVASSNSLQRKGLYAAGELSVTKTTGEDGHVTYIFTDKLGQVILERMMNGTKRNDTYYVYDEFGNLSYILPPAASDALGTNTIWEDTDMTLRNFAYVYKYDEFRHCIQKRLPGCDPVEIRYDKANRLIFSQDGVQREKNQWTFFFYDTLGREVVTGIWESSTIANVMNMVVKTDYNSGSTGTKLGGYTVNLTLPATVRLMKVHYYDDYRFRRIQTALSDTTKLKCITLAGYDSAYPNNSAPNGRGMLTGIRIHRLDDPTRYTISALYYDSRSRVVQSHTSNHFEGFEDKYFAYTFTGKVKQHRQIHSAPGKTTYTETYTYYYGTPQTNPSERLLSLRHQVNSASEVTLAEYDYDEIGRLKTKKLANETSTYHYNVRSWLTQIAGTKFNQTMTYNAAVNGVTPAKALYNGNISAMKWKSGHETTERGYKFTYDSLNRLTAATYGEGTGFTTNPNRFNENITYNDKMGNIKTLQRRGKIAENGYDLMDNLTYSYTGNQLTKVTDAVTTPIAYQAAFHFVDRANTSIEYEYNKNGNLKKDLNRNITSITYNELNLPSVITFSDNKSITYGYDAAGSKLSVAYLSDGVTSRMDYVGNKVYNNGTLSTLLTEEGYIEPGTTPTYHYYLKDHQGNNRVVISQTGTVEEVNHYYPFGGLFDEGLQNSNQRYKYNGKEFDHKYDLDMYDYGARHYDPALGRWFTVDPLAEKYYSSSPYVYCGNNPVRFIDPNGMWYGDPPSNWLIPSRPKYEYGNNLLTNSLTFANNVSADILNSGISIINTPINAAQTLYKEGVTGLVNSEIAGLKNAGNAIADEVSYTLTTPLGEQLQGFKDPATWEAGVTFGATLFTGGVAANLGKGATVANSTTTATAAKMSTNVLSKGELLRIENAATRINKPITVVGSRAKGTAGPYSDWDYVIPGLTNKNWKTIKNSLPGSKSVMDNMPRNIDLHQPPVRIHEPHIIINPR